jgi:hypothetical protein
LERHVGAGGGIEEEDVLELLSMLVDKSLVVAEESWESGARYRLLEPIRQYALEKLEGSVEAVKRWRQATSCAERYVAKPEAFPAGLKTGRVWGVWNGRLLPVRWEKVQVALRDAFRIRRVYRKLARRKGRGPISRITVFVRHENALRLLGYLGYRLE